MSTSVIFHCCFSWLTSLISIQITSERLRGSSTVWLCQKCCENSACSKLLGQTPALKKRVNYLIPGVFFIWFLYTARLHSDLYNESLRHTAQLDTESLTVSMAAHLAPDDPALCVVGCNILWINIILYIIPPLALCNRQLRFVCVLLGNMQNLLNKVYSLSSEHCSLSINFILI